MNITTGTTVNEIIVSIDINNNPVSATSFNTLFFVNGAIVTGMTPSVTLVDPVSAVFDISWSASTLGFTQVYAYNTATTVIYISELYNVVTETVPTIYVGL